MSVKTLIKEIAELKGIDLTVADINEINSKLASAYLDTLLDNQKEIKDEQRSNAG